MYVPKESSFPIPSKYIDVARQSKNKLDKLRESNTDLLWNIDEKKNSHVWVTGKFFFKVFL